MFDYILLFAGLAILIIGGDALVRGAVGLAEKLNVPPLIIGLTIVSFGTSAPELFISVGAALDGAGGIAVGNVVGSNIANVLLVMGIPALIRASQCDEEGIGRNILVMLGVTAVFMGMMSKGALTRFDGIILLTLLLLFLYDQFRSAQKARREGAEEPDYHDEVENVPTSPLWIGALILFGLVALPLGAELTVNSATNIARSWNVSDEVIGLTIVAFGTSLPELATTLMAVVRRNSSVAIGNIVGSNILNIVAIMGATATIAPVAVGMNIVWFDMWVMLATSILIAGLAHYSVKLGKRMGLAMSLAYAIYIVTVFNI